MIRRSAEAPTPAWWAACNLAALAAGQGDYEVALAALERLPRPARGAPGRTAALLGDMIRWRMKYIDIIHYDNIILNNIHYNNTFTNNKHYINCYSNNELYDIYNSHVVELVYLRNTHIYDPVSGMRAAARAQGLRLLDATEAAETVDRFGPDAHEILAFLGAAARASTTAVLVGAPAAARILPHPLDRLDGFAAPPLAALQIEGSFPFAGPLGSLEARLLGVRDPGTRPVLLYDGTVRH